MLSAWSEINRAFDEFDRMLRTLDVVEPRSARSYTTLRVNVNETEDAWQLQALVPGVPRESVEVTVDGGRHLLLTAERAVDAPEGYRPTRRERGSFRFTRSLTLPREVDVENVSATVKNGVLTVRLPKRPETRPRQVQVQVG